MGTFPASKRPEKLAAMLQVKAMEVLGVTDASAVSINQPLSELGLDSMLAVELRNELVDMVGSNLPGTLLFDYPTIQDISGYLLNDVLALTDDDEADDTKNAGAMSQE